VLPRICAQTPLKAQQSLWLIQLIIAFIWLSLIKIQRLHFQLEHFVILAIGLIAVVLLNTHASALR
jgi:hypothetical protein